jgi:hypothetical protein
MTDQTPVDLPVKTGLSTTELWTTALTNLLSFAVAIATIVGRPFDGSSLQALVPAVAMLAAAITSAIYARSRTALKMAAFATMTAAPAAAPSAQTVTSTSPAPATTTPALVGAR